MAHDRREEAVPEGFGFDLAQNNVACHNQVKTHDASQVHNFNLHQNPLVSRFASDYG